MPTHHIELIKADPSAIVFKPKLGQAPNVMAFGQPSEVKINAARIYRLDSLYRIRIPPGLQAAVRPHYYLAHLFPCIQLGKPYVLGAGEHPVQVHVRAAIDSMGGQTVMKGKILYRGFPIVEIEIQYAPVVEWRVEGVQYRLPAQIDHNIRPPYANCESDKRFREYRTGPAPFRGFYQPKPATEEGKE